MKSPFERCPIRLVAYKPGDGHVHLAVDGLKMAIELTPGEALQLGADLLEVGIRRDETMHRLIKCFIESDRRAIQ